jgi:hypothetical protein
MIGQEESTKPILLFRDPKSNIKISSKGTVSRTLLDTVHLFVLIFSKISPIFEIVLCLCADCKENCRTQPITVELTTYIEFKRGNIVHLDSTDDLANNFFFNTRPAA